jgi:glycine cleavage system H lipoate-binding protein
MVMVLVVLTFAVFIALDYFVFSKRPATASTVAPVPGRAPLPATGQPVPRGIFLHPTFTWGRFGSTGELYLGVHPMLLGLVGTPYELELRKWGEHVAKGEPLVRVARGGHHLDVRSPIAGRVDLVNRNMTGETLWRDLEENDGSWLYRLQPESIADEVRTWLTGEPAAEWTRRQYDRLKTYLQNAAADGHLGTVMADGGELSPGVLGDMDESVWAGLEDGFLAHGEGTR